LIVFDFDGVIADTLGICARACAHAARQQGFGDALPENPFADLEQVSFEGLAANLGLKTSAFAGDACSYLEQCSEVAPIFQGMSETLRHLSSASPVCILSASPRRTIERFLEFHGCGGYVHKIISRDTPGGKAEKLKGLKNDGTQPPVCMIGDGVSDILAAKQAGVPSIGVSWGWQAASQLTEAGADFIAGTPADISGMV